MASSGQPVRLSRPLDFLVVADHSDGFGFFPQLMSGDPELLATEQGRRWSQSQIKNGQGAEAAFDIIRIDRRARCPRGSRSPAQAPTTQHGRRSSRRRKATNEPGRFTAFVGTEWTSNSGGNNLHRNIIFRGGRLPRRAWSSPTPRRTPLGSDNPEDLWKWMAATRGRTRPGTSPRDRPQRQPE